MPSSPNWPLSARPALYPHRRQASGTGLSPPACCPIPATAGAGATGAAKNGIGEILPAYTQSFELADPKIYDFDAAIEFPPNNASPTVLTDRVKGWTRNSNGIIYDWNSASTAAATIRSPIIG